MHHRRSVRVSLLTALALALVAAACSSDDGDGADAPTTTTVIDDATTTSPSTAPPSPTAPETTNAPVTTLPADAEDGDDESPQYSSTIITGLDATGTGGRSAFDGTVDDRADLDDLVADAWGVAELGLHRGHAQIEGVLEVFLGIDHDEMHVYMEDQGLNLAETSMALDLDPEDLIETLTLSYDHFLEEGVANGVLAEDEVPEWQDAIRTEFRNRVYWEG